ncbi:MAG: PIN domain protein [bacterium]
MKTQRIYLDTSVIGGCFDHEFATWSNALMKDIKTGLFRGVTSEIVEAEISDAPKNVREQFIEFLKMNPEVQKISEEAIKLVDVYLQHKILSERFRNDMLHIALSTIGDVDILVSWNFRHIVRYDKIRQFNAVNLEQGYHTLDIYSPREVTSYEKD